MDENIIEIEFNAINVIENNRMSLKCIELSLNAIKYHRKSKNTLTIQYIMS